MGESGPSQVRTVFDELGDETFTRLVDAFYRRVREDSVMAPMYDGDFEGANERLRLFLVQYWGGPTTYSDTRGHPRLRMRHAPFRIDRDARDRWLAHMRAAMDEVQIPPLYAAALDDYFERASTAMINTL